VAGKRKGLGRGLEALLGTATEPDGAGTAESPSSQDGQLRNLPLEFLQRGKYQPRRDMHPEALEELAESIRSQGVMQPVVVRPIGPDRYEIIAGERRWRAAQMAQLDTIPALIRDVPDEAAIAMALIENIQREDLNPIEEAQALLRLKDEFQLTHEQVAQAVSKSRVAVTNLMRLMSLEPEVRKLLEHGDLEMGHGRALLGLEGRAQLEIARQVAAKGHTVRQTEALVRHYQASRDQTGPQTLRQPTADIRRLQDQLSDTLGAAVAIQHGAKGKGRLVISYNSLDELEGILTHIK